MSRSGQRSNVSWLASIAPVIYFVLIWLLASLMLGPARLPGPEVVVQLFVRSAVSDAIVASQGGGEHGFFPHVVSTLVHTCLGVLVGAIAGFVAALLFSQNKLALNAADLVVELARVVPPLIFIPFAAIALGSSYSVETVSVAIYAALAMTVYSLGAMKNVSQDLLFLGHLLGASRLRVVMTVQIPAMLPFLVGPLRVIVSLGLGVGVVAEFLAAPSGIGRLMKFAMSYSRVDMILVGVVWAVMLVLMLDLAITYIAKRTLRWMA